MIVLDASAGIDWLMGRPAGRAVAARFADPAQSVHIPHLWMVEVLQVIRRFEAAGDLSEGRALQAITDARDLPASRYEHEVLAPRVWELRHNLTAYDAVYVALAEVLDAPLLTTDARLAAAPGNDASIQLLTG